MDKAKFQQQQPAFRHWAILKAPAQRQFGKWWSSPCLLIIPAHHGLCWVFSSSSAEPQAWPLDLGPELPWLMVGNHSGLRVEIEQVGFFICSHDPQINQQRRGGDWLPLVQATRSALPSLLSIFQGLTGQQPLHRWQQGED